MLFSLHIMSAICKEQKMRQSEHLQRLSSEWSTFLKTGSDIPYAQDSKRYFDRIFKFLLLLTVIFQSVTVRFKKTRGNWTFKLLRIT